ncbi:MAG TPA: LPS export ABC transporter periplasmic protein LptC [Casimicrobiaceae bacterium]|nr:LPS export ABC transporter periplasmic protein LptC [Casimicrobiaceae bacterium]
MNARVWLDRLVTWSPVLLLGALAGLTYWLNSQVLLAAPAFDGSGRHDPDVFVENFKAVNLDEDGRVRQALDATRAEHFPDDDTTVFDAPAVTFTDPGKPRLDVTADHATVTGDRENVYFKGHVKAIREASVAASEKPDGPITVTSDFLHVFPNEDRIVTDRAVTITEPRGSISAIGMELNDKAKTAKFGSHVSGQMLPQAISQ